MEQLFPFVAHFPEYDVRRLFRCDPNMTALEVCDFVVSKMEFLRKNERFLVFCDERRDRSQLVFPEHETLKESGVPSGTTLVFRQTGQDLYFILDREGGINLSLALTHPSRTVVRVDLFAPLRASAAAVAARLGAGSGAHELAFCALADRGTRALRLALSLHAQHVGSVVVAQPAAVLLKTSLEALANVARAGWLVKKSIKHDKVTKNKRRWCVLADLRLYYFKSNTALARPAGVILLEYYSVSDKSMSGQFLLQHLPDAGRNSAPDFVLSLESFNEKELDDWKWAIRERCDNPPLLGVPLVELSRLNGGQPPLLFDATIDHLLSVAPESEGVFRLSGSQSEVDQVLEDFVFGRNPVLANRSVHVVCGVLKQWLRELPNPLLTYELHDAFCLAVQKRTHDEVMSALQKCLLKLPAIHLTVLEGLLGLCEAIDLAADRTLMNARNLALALTPAILISPSRDPLPSKEQLLCVTLLVQHRSELLSSLEQMAEEEEPGRLRPRPVLPGVSAPSSSTSGVAVVGSPIASKTIRGLPATQRTAATPAPRPKASDVFAAGAPPVSPASPPPAGPPPSVAGSSSAPAPSTWLVKFAYAARTEKEMSVSAGQEVVVTRTFANGWALAETRDGLRGLVPAAFLVEQGSGALSTSSSASSAPLTSSAASTSSSSLPTAVSAAGAPPTSPRRDLPFASVRAASPRRVAPSADVFAAQPQQLQQQQQQQQQRKSDGSSPGEELAVLRREMEQMRQQNEQERENNARVQKELSDGLLQCRKEVERLRLALNRVVREKDASDMLMGQKFVELEEEIEVLDTRIEQEEGNRVALANEVAEDRAVVDKIQAIVDAWSQ